MSDPDQYRLHISAHTPDTIGMGLLAEYMTRFARLLGHEYSIHFIALSGGSTELVCHVAPVDQENVRQRLDDVRNGRAGRDAVRDLDDLLRKDDAEGRVISCRNGVDGVILVLEGKGQKQPARVGPISQDGTLDGVLVSVGGIDKTISLRLRIENQIVAGLETTREIAKQLALHLFDPIRVFGSGRWTRNGTGKWSLRSFQVTDFRVLADETLKDALSSLRQIPGSEWMTHDDPLAVLRNLREDNNGLH